MLKYMYLALLRGINVGGKNIIRMTDLRQCFEEMGYKDVITYIQSGNVIFSSDETNLKNMTDKIEKGLSERFKYDSMIILIPGQILNEIVTHSPEGFGKEQDKYRYDVIFFRDQLSPAEVIKELKPKPGVDEATSGVHTLYFRRLIIKASQSRLIKLISMPVYKHLSVRNWNTTVKLHELINS